MGVTRPLLLGAGASLVPLRVNTGVVISMRRPWLLLPNM
jgi:hypothetical protein